MYSGTFTPCDYFIQKKAKKKKKKNGIYNRKLNKFELFAVAVAKDEGCLGNISP